MYKPVLFSIFTVLYIAISSFSISTADDTTSTQASLKRRAYKTKHVIVLIIDGPRWTETFGDTSCSNIPRMGKEMIHEGVLFTNFRNNGVTETNSGHTAIVTGVYDKVSNNGKEIPKNPSMFQYYLKASQSDRNEAWIVASKGKLEILGNCKNKTWWNTYMPYTYCGPNGNSAEYVGDKFTFARVKEVIDLHTPNLMLINLLEADVRCHENKWDEYLKALKNCDNYAYELWNYIQDNPEMKNSTTLLITNDHGRHLDGRRTGFVNHGDGCEGCRHISLLAIGPDFKKDVIVREEGELIDLSKTISQLLGFDMPTTKGRVLTELF
jgi:hypothetical protein